MFSLGCIQALRCHQNTCPTGVTTHNKRLQRALVVEEKYLRVANYAMNMNKEIDMIAHSCGVRHARELTREHVRIVQASGQSVALNMLYPYPEPKAQDEGGVTRFLLLLALLPAPAFALSPAAQEFMTISKELEPVQCEKRQLRRKIALAEAERRDADAKAARARFATAQQGSEDRAAGEAPRRARAAPAQELRPRGPPGDQPAAARGVLSV